MHFSQSKAKIYSKNVWVERLNFLDTTVFQKYQNFSAFPVLIVVKLSIGNWLDFRLYCNDTFLWMNCSAWPGSRYLNWVRKPRILNLNLSSDMTTTTQNAISDNAISPVFWYDWMRPLNDICFELAFRICDIDIFDIFRPTPMLFKTLTNWELDIFVWN